MTHPQGRAAAAAARAGPAAVSRPGRRQRPDGAALRRAGRLVEAAEPLGDFAYVGATVGPGFDFADFAFGRDDAALRQALTENAPDLVRLF